ncbi:rho GTPase-activating protein 12b isoform X7 [Hypanus sabinus]|uniref:rho GTPase-activating protein 12b isoform X7 n=1 Tax=Hypanus sabinus TaxID=79690 RepID=UPI0028C4AB81|nr:rho GTPase-activating protein 12b isoform X7 [Hypanus sabinus]
MAEKDRKPDVPVVPGQVYIEVEYDYEYEAKDRTISIKEGERYILLKKTNNDWWQVKKDDSSKPFYLPAQYVKELPRKALMPPVKRVPSSVKAKSASLGADAKLQQVSNENVSKSPDYMSAFKSSMGQLQIKTSSENQTTNLNTSQIQNEDQVQVMVHSHSGIQSSVKVGNQSHGHGEGETQYSRITDPNRILAHSQDFDAMDVDKLVHEHSSEWTPESSEKHQDSESGDECSSSSTEQLQYNVPAKQEVISKSRSLDRKPEPLVLTNWRHSTYGVSHLDLEKFTSKKHKRNSSEHLCAPSSHLFSQHPDQELATSPKLIHDNNNEPPSSPKSPQPSPTVSEKYGLLYMTKITENGKKVRKNWTSSWTVLQGSSLLFAKNQGSGTGWKFGNTQSKPEFTVDLKGAAIEWASKDKSSKKNVIELRTRQGTELLIQLDNDNLINEWYKALEETISSQTESDEDDMPESPVIEKQDKDKNNKDLKKSRPMKSSSNVDNADQKKTKTKLKKFLTRRPTLQAVRDKGYIKDQVFGCNLNSLCQREGTTIPKFVTLCIDHVEKEGLNIDGLYRVSGNLAVIQKLRFAVNHDEKLDLKDNKWEDINVITGALKMFFRELPEPLFTYHLFNDFINAIKSPDYKLRIQGIKELVRQLPKPNHDTMQVLFKHLVKVIACGELNRMTTQSVAIVFGPTLLRPEKEVNNIAVHMVYQNQIVELILTEIETIFGRS